MNKKVNELPALKAEIREEYEKVWTEFPHITDSGVKQMVDFCVKEITHATRLTDGSIFIIKKDYTYCNLNDRDEAIAIKSFFDVLYGKHPYRKPYALRMAYYMSATTDEVIPTKLVEFSQHTLADYYCYKHRPQSMTERFFLLEGEDLAKVTALWEMQEEERKSRDSEEQWY